MECAVGKESSRRHIQPQTVGRMPGTGNEDRVRELVTMGAWGTGPFDNDDGMDFFLDLEDAPAEAVTSRVRDVLSLAASDDAFVDEHLAGEALAAAAVVAHWCLSSARSTVGRAATDGGAARTDSDAAPAQGDAAAGVAGNPRVADWLATHPPALAPADADLAVRALDRMSDERCEWNSLWAHAGRGEEARAVIERLRGALLARV